MYTRVESVLSPLSSQFLYIPILQEYMKGIRDVLYWFVTNFGPRYPPTEANPQSSLKNSLALDISFGSIGYALILARPFITVSVR